MIEPRDHHLDCNRRPCMCNALMKTDENESYEKGFWEGYNTAKSEVIREIASFCVERLSKKKALRGGGCSVEEE